MLVRPSLRLLASRSLSTKGSPLPIPQVETDALCLPLKPTWSVKELLSFYPAPSLPAETINKLHSLAALQPPAAGSHKFEKLQNELEELVRLVDAVKMVEIPQQDGESIPDGRIWPQGRGMTLDARDSAEISKGHPSGRQLLEHATRTDDGFYMVDFTRKR